MSNNEIEEEIINSVILKIEEYIRNISPIKKIIIAFDGVAPVAKLSQQRSRRYKSSYQKRILDKLIGKRGYIEWDTVAITPGTTFMKTLGDRVSSHFRDEKKYKIDEIVVSGAEEIGEGEHKIFKYIRDNREYHKNKKTVIYGLDADLIMLGLNHVETCPNLYLYRETPHFIESIDNTLSPDKSYLIDINKFSVCLKNELNINFGMSDDNNCIRDYVFICFMLGNDFLPHFPALNIRTTGIGTVTSNYSECCKGNKRFKLVTKNDRINWRDYREYIKILSQREEELIKEEYNKRRASRRYQRPVEGMHEIEDKLLKLPQTEREIEEYINPFDKGWEARYYKELFEIDIDDERRKEICVNYLEGLEWTLKYYTIDCPDWEWKYKYHYPPLLSDLSKYIPYFDTNFIDNNCSKAVSPLVQLSYVVPRGSLNLISVKVLDKMGRDRINEWYKEDNELLWAYCKYFWEAHVKMPNIDIDELKLIIGEEI